MLFSRKRFPELAKEKIDIAIISYNSLDFNLRCVESIFKSQISRDFTIILADNASDYDCLSPVVKKFPSVKTVRFEKNLGYGRAANLALENSDADYFIISNADVEFKKNAIETLIDFLASAPKAGIVGAAQIYPDGRRQIAYGTFPGVKLGLTRALFIEQILNAAKNALWKLGFRAKSPKKVDYPDGAVLAVKAELFKKIGGFDPDFFFYSEETDLAYRAFKLGRQNYVSRDAEVIHRRGGSGDLNDDKRKTFKALVESKILFCRKHRSYLTTKLYIIGEILAAANNAAIRALPAAVSPRTKARKFKESLLYLNVWLEEFNAFLKNETKWRKNAT